jgi:hypothetical protein
VTAKKKPIPRRRKLSAMELEAGHLAGVRKRLRSGTWGDQDWSYLEYRGVVGGQYGSEWHERNAVRIKELRHPGHHPSNPNLCHVCYRRWRTDDDEGLTLVPMRR